VFFSGGGGLLLLMQPVKPVATHAIMNQFTNIFTIHSRGVREIATAERYTRGVGLVGIGCEDLGVSELADFPTLAKDRNRTSWD